MIFSVMSVALVSGRYSMMWNDVVDKAEDKTALKELESLLTTLLKNLKQEKTSVAQSKETLQMLPWIAAHIMLVLSIA